MTDKIKIMLLATNPLRLAYVRLGDEIREIDKNIQSALHPDAFETIAKPAVRVSDLGGYLLRGQPHIVHFSGHGKRVGGLILEGDAEGGKTIGPTELTDIFRMLKDSLRLVF